MKNLDVRWIIESDVLSYTDNLIGYLRANDIYYKETTYQELVSCSYKDKYGYLSDDEVATIFVGSLRAAKEINNYPIGPGAICNLKNFDCLNYYSSWRNYILNDDYELVNSPILQRMLKAAEGEDKTYFFRPSAGDKSFTGGVYTISTVNEFLQSDNQIVIKASEKCLGDEYRFLVVDKEIVDGTRYSEDSSLESLGIVKNYLERILQYKNLFIPDRAFTVDIGFNVDIGKLKVIEINSFSCANLYEMNMNKVVPAINQLIRDIYNENNED